MSSQSHAGKVPRHITTAVTAAIAAILVAAALVAAPAADGHVGPTGADDYGGFLNVLAGGQGQTVNASGLAAYEANGQPPDSFVNQEGLYTRLPSLAPGVTAANLPQVFKSGEFGIAPGQLQSSESPRAGVTIERDAYHVPHVYGQTRSDVMFGAGYVSAEDRLFLMDVLRHTARGTLTDLIGAGPGDSTAQMDAQMLKIADYSDPELQRQIDSAVARYGAEGQQVAQDSTDYTAGINAYIAQARLDPNLLPSEYVAIGQMPADWKIIDSIAVASLINTQEGMGGGAEELVSQVLEAAQRRFGPGDGRRVFADFREQEDPEAVVTTHRRFPFDDPGPVNPAAVAEPDFGSIHPRNPIVSGASPAPAGPTNPQIAAAGMREPAWLLELQLHGLRLARSDSNATLIDASHSSSGHPLAVMGPQVGYYSPQILMELDLHGGGIDAEGAAFPGISQYVLLGHARDYAWSATSSNSDDSEIFAERLCNPDGSPATQSSGDYVYRGQCVPFVTRDVTLQSPTNLDNTAPPKTVVLRVQRSVHGPIQGYARVDGAPVALALARSTYFHEADAAIAFMRLNENAVTDAPSFEQTMSQINSTFNWFYADDRDIAYELSGSYPLRAHGVDPNLPVWGTGNFDWQGFAPGDYTFAAMAGGSLPKDVDPAQGYLVSWNNKPAPGWRASTDKFSYGPVHRAQILERRVQAALSDGRKLDLPQLVGIMGDAATVDLRGEEDYPWLRKVIGTTTDPQIAPLLAALDSWAASGAHRRDRSGRGYYDDSAAVALMDAWWPRLVDAMFQPAIGQDLMSRIEAILPVDDPPNPSGNAYETAWYSLVQKDLRDLLSQSPPAPPRLGGQKHSKVCHRHACPRHRRRGRHPHPGRGATRRGLHVRHHRARPATPPGLGRFSRVYCGGGSLTACRQALIVSLEQAAAAVRQRYGPDMDSWRVSSTCTPGQTPPACDQLEFVSAGAVDTPPIPWQNRGTFQQAVEVQGHRPR